MASSLRLILSAILFLSLIQSGQAKTSTENLIVKKSDILEFKKSTEIEEGDFFEDVQTNLEEYVWVVNLKNGPFSSEEKANQAALELKKTLGITLPKLPKEISILRKSKSPNNKNFNKAKFSWMINLRLGVYDSKDKALQIAQELKAIQKVPENVFLTRETKDIKTSKFAKKITPEVSGQIFLSREATPIKDKIKHFILVATKSNSLNVRKNPSSSSPVIARLLKGSKVPHIKNNTPENRNGSWFYIEYSKGKFGWVSSSYTKKITDSGSRISQQANLKTVKPKQVHTSEAPRTSEFRELKSLVALLQTELDKVKTDKTKAIEATNQANTKANEKKLASLKEFNSLKEKNAKETKDLQTITAYLRSELNKIKSDKTNAIEARNRSRAKLEISVTESNKKIKDLQTTTASLLSELDKITTDKVKAIEAANQANAKANEEKLSSAKEFKRLKNISSKQIKDLQTTTTSLRSELDKIITDKAKAMEATNQANTKANEEKLASSKKFQSLKDKSSKQIKDLQTTTASLRSELDMITTDKTNAIEAANQANSREKEERLASSNEKNMLKEKINTLRVVLENFKIDKEKTTQATNQANSRVKEERLASSKEFKSLKDKSSKQIKDLQTTTASLRSELDMIKTDKAKAIEATNQANSRVKEERLASSKEFQSLKDKSSKQIKDLQTTTTSFRSELDKITTDKAKAIEATNQANAKANEEKLASSNEKNMLKEKINTLRVLLENLKIDKEKTTQVTNQANSRAKEERLASVKAFKSLKDKSSKQIKDLQTTTASLRSELDMIKTDKAKTIEATNRANTKAKEERLASSKEFKSLKDKSSKQINDFQASTASLRSELDKIKMDKAREIEVFVRASSKLQAEKLANAKLMASLKVNNEKEISNLREKNSNKIKNLKEKTLKEIVDLKFSTASLQKELEMIKGDKEDAINAVDQINAKLQATNLNNLKFTKKLKDTVIFLRKELDNLKEEKTEPIKAVNQTNDKLKAEKLANSTEINNINEASREKILGLKTTVAYLRSELNKAKDDRTNKLTAINQASIKSNKRFKESSTGEIKTLNSTIKNLRAVLERFKIERLKSAEARKSSETKIETEQTIREKEINILKKESITLKLQLDKANLHRVKAIEGVNFNNIETQADLLAQDNEFKEYRLKSTREIAELRDEATSLRNQLAHLMSDRTRSTQPKTLLSSAKKLRGLNSPASTKQKNKTAGILDKPAKKKIISGKKLLPSSTDINPESVINSKLLHWGKAWESRNIPLYLSFYSKSFKDPKRSRSLWESHRRKSLENTLNILIQITNIKTYITSKNIISVTFVQRFKSNKFSDVGLKELIWKKGTDGWKIIKETWKPR